MDSAYVSQWTLYYNMPGEQDKEQLYPLAVLKTYFEHDNRVICDYSSTSSSHGVLDISLWSGSTISFNPASNPYFHKIPGTADYLCITSAANPEVCQW